jgi:HEPN domain-containing protein
MESSDTEYRLRLAEGFLKEAREQLKYGLFRAVADAAQLAVENSVKAVIARFRPVPKTHDLDEAIGDLLDEVGFSDVEKSKLSRLRELAESLGFETHIRTDYGDESQHSTPWELYDEHEAREALGMAEEGYRVAEEFVRNRERGNRR